MSGSLNTFTNIPYSALVITGSITNADISPSAAIAYSKLNLTGSIVNADVNASAAIAYGKLALTGSIVNADLSASAAIAYSKLALTGSLVNADVSASAAIAYSKLAALPSANILVGNGSNVATAVGMTGQATITNAGVVVLDNSSVIGKVLTGYVSSAGTVAATDTILQAIQKLNGNQTTLASAKIIVGNGSNVATAVDMSGDVFIANSGQTTIQPGVVTNAKLTNVSTGTFKARATGGSGSIEDLTSAQAAALLPAYIGDSGAGGVKGLVPAPALGEAALFLRGDGIWAAPSGSGTVTSVGLAVPPTSLFSVSNSPITSSGNLLLATAGTSGGIPYFSSVSQMNSSALLAANAIVLGGGAGTAPATLASLGTTSTVLHGNAAGAPTFGQIVNADITNATIDLTTKVTGVLPLANGGTAKALTAVAGGLVYTDSDSMEVTAAGTAGQVLRSAGSGTPTWGTDVLGVATTGLAAAGYKGEYIESVVSNVNFPTTAQYGDITSIALTAGDWDITYTLAVDKNGATANGGFEYAISSTSGNSSSGFVAGSNYMFMSAFVSGASDNSGCIPSYRVSISGNTTYYAKVKTTYTGGPVRASGARLSARRIR